MFYLRLVCKTSLRLNRQNEFLEKFKMKKNIVTGSFSHFAVWSCPIFITTSYGCYTYVVCNFIEAQQMLPCWQWWWGDDTSDNDTPWHNWWHDDTWWHWHQTRRPPRGETLTRIMLLWPNWLLCPGLLCDINSQILMGTGSTDYDHQWVWLSMVVPDIV